MLGIHLCVNECMRMYVDTACMYKGKALLPCTMLHFALQKNIAIQVCSVQCAVCTLRLYMCNIIITESVISYAAIGNDINKDISSIQK